MSGGNKTQNLQNNTEDTEIDETEEFEYDNGRLYEKVYETAEKFASTSVGQYATEKADRILKLIEDTAKWSLPTNNSERNDSGIQLERPLPWIPFIALILVLRLIRMTLSICGLFIGNSPLVPSDVVYFIQTRRRKLRAIRIVGIREIRKKEQEAKQIQGNGIFSKITSLLAMAICRPSQDQVTHKIVTVNNDCLNDASCSTDALNQRNVISKKQRARDENLSDQELTLNQIIDKYGDANSEDDDDSDFIPPNVLNDEDTSSESTSSASSDDDDTDIEENLVQNEDIHTKSNTKSGSNANMTNGNTNTEKEILDQSVDIKENGKHSGKGFGSAKAIHRPIPIQQIKLEPDDNLEEIFGNHQHYEETSQELKASNHHNQQQQTIIARNDGSERKEIAVADNLKETQHSKSNGLDGSLKSGSPDLYGTTDSEFRPTSILKNFQTVNIENIGASSVLGESDLFIKAEGASETYSASTSNQLTRRNFNNNGKPNKNKFRGKRR